MASEEKGDLSASFVMEVLQVEHLNQVVDKTLGEGYLLSVGPDPKPLMVTVYPHTRNVEIFSTLSGLRLTDIREVRRRDHDLLLDSTDGNEALTMGLTSSGEFRLTRRLVGSPTTFEEKILETKPEDPRPSRQPEPIAEPVVETGSQQERERITIRGRVGRSPRFRTTAKRDVLIASFPLGEHPDLDTTVWHSIVLFGDRARKLQEKGLSAGQEIEVVGYVHNRNVRARGGQDATLTEIYATAIRTTLQKPPSGS